jgi:hypothetical protein
MQSKAKSSPWFPVALKIKKKSMVLQLSGRDHASA